MEETYILTYCFLYTSLVSQTVKHLATMWETRIQSLDREDLLEKEMTTHSNILAWKIPWTEEPGRLQSTGSQTVGHDWATSLLHFTSRDLDYENSLGLNAKHVESSSCSSYIEGKRWMGIILIMSCSDNFHRSFRQLECHLRKSNRLKILEGFDINFYPFLRIKTVLKFCFLICQAEQVNFIYKVPA